MVKGKNSARSARALEGASTLLVVGAVDAIDGLGFLQERGHSIHRVAGLAEALALSVPDGYGVVLADVSAPQGCALTDLSQLKKAYPESKLIAIDGKGSIEAAVAAIKAGAWDYLHQPISLDELAEKITEAQMTTEESVLRQADPVVTYIGRHATAISSRAEVANRFGLSLDTISSRVRTVTGRTFIEYLHHCRLDQAKSLLESTELNISQVAARVGFSTPQHFSRVFRKHTNLSPARYRLQERGRKIRSTEN